jgi:hypothetical protein
MVHSLLFQMLKMSATISVLLIMMCNRSEYFLQVLSGLAANTVLCLRYYTILQSTPQLVLEEVPCPSSRKVNIQKISHIIVVMWWCTIVTLTFFLQKTKWCKVQGCPAAWICRQHLWHLLSRKTAIWVLWKIECTTLTRPLRVTAQSSVMCGFSVTHYRHSRAPLSSRVAKSDETGKSGKYFFFSLHVCKNHSFGCGIRSSFF